MVELISDERLECVTDRRNVLEPADPRLNVARVCELTTEENNGHHDDRGESHSHLLASEDARHEIAEGGRALSEKEDDQIEVEELACSDC